jgi:hypothetical protein
VTLPSGGPEQRGGLSKRARGLIIVVVAAMWLVGGSAWVRGTRTAADNDLDAAAQQARDAAPDVDPQVVFPAWAAAMTSGQGGNAVLNMPEVPRLAHAQTVDVDAKPGLVTVTYRIDSWGEHRCLKLTRTTADWSVGQTACP